MRHAAIRCAFLIALLLVSVNTTAVHAQRWGRSREWSRDGSATRAAFAPTVRDAKAATVQIEVDGKQVAYGLCVDRNGWILTKASTVPLEADCVLADGRRLRGVRTTIIVEHDLALLHVAASDLPVVPWSEAGEPGVGRWIAVPGSTASPIAVGIVSVPSRKIDQERGFLGIEIEDIEGAGARIKAVIDRTPAQRAGLRQEDVVLSVNGTDVAGRDSLVQQIRGVGAGGALELKIRRGAQEITLRAVVGQRNFDPYDIENSGRVSLRHSGFANAFQLDAVVKPEECGGPLVDLSGKVVGVMIARANRATSYGVPAGTVRAALRKVLEKPAELR